MRLGVTTLGCIAGICTTLWMAGYALAADSTGSPYQPILDRNVFGLRPPPPPPEPASTKPPPPKITLQGITTMRGNKLALMKVLVPPSKPGTKAEEIPLILGVGQKSEDVEVLEIDEKAGAVKVNDFGTITNLTFKENGVNLASAAPAAPPHPGVPPHPGAPGVPPPQAHTFNPAYRPNTGGYQRPYIPNSRMNSTRATGYSPTAAAPNTYSAVPNVYSAVPVAGGTPTGSAPGTVALNGLANPANTGVHEFKSWPPETPMSPEESAIMEAAYTMKYQKQIQAGSMPPIPGSNPLLDSGNSQQRPSGF